MSHGAIYLPEPYSATPSKSGIKARTTWILLLGILATSVILLIHLLGPTLILFNNGSSLLKTHGHGHNHDHPSTGGCIQAEPRMPEGYNVSKILEEKERIIDLLSEAVSLASLRCYRID